MNENEYDKASRFWSDKEKALKRMGKKELQEEIDAFLKTHNTCALATGCGEFVRCTPIEYTYMEKRIWILTEGGLKFLGLKENKNVSIGIYNEYEGFGTVKGMQVSGTAELVELFSEQYRKLLDYKQLSEEALKKLSHPMYLIAVTPSRIDFLNADFKKKGFSARQFIEYE